MSEFTQGKWITDTRTIRVSCRVLCAVRADDRRNDDDRTVVYIPSCFNDRAIAYIPLTRNGSIPQQEAKANARLISTAPEMYELLYEALQELKGYDPIGNRISTVYPDIEELLARIDGEEAEA